MKLPLVNPNRVLRDKPFFGKRKRNLNLLKDRIDYLEKRLNIIERNTKLKADILDDRCPTASKCVYSPDGKTCGVNECAMG